MQLLPGYVEADILQLGCNQKFADDSGVRHPRRLEIEITEDALIPTTLLLSTMSIRADIQASIMEQPPRSGGAAAN
jgi:hypothetical protein